MGHLAFFGFGLLDLQRFPDLGTEHRSFGVGAALLVASIAAFGQKSRQERRLKVKPLAKLPMKIPGVPYYGYSRMYPKNPNVGT